MIPRKSKAVAKRQHAEQPLPPLQFTQRLPYGAVLHDAGDRRGRGVQFIVYSRSATAMRVLLYDRVDDPEPAEVIALDPSKDRWGDIWSIFVPGVEPGQLYHFQADGPFEPDRGQRFDGTARLIDPYSRALAGRFLQGDDGIIRPPKSVVVDDSFDWQGDRHLRRGLADTVIYEMHVKGFTASPTRAAAIPAPRSAPAGRPYCCRCRRTNRAPPPCCPGLIAPTGLDPRRFRAPPAGRRDRYETPVEIRRSRD
jgi:pullulanase/glycogen debranching enzyme